MSAIESEVESVTDGSAARFVAERVKAELAVAGHQPQSAASDRHLQGGAGRARSPAARPRGGRAASRGGTGTSRRPGSICGRVWAQLADTDAVRAREAAAAEAARARSKKRARRATSARRPSRSWHRCEQHLAALSSALATFDRRASDLAKIESAAAEAGPLLAEAETRAEACAARARRAPPARNAMKTALSALELARRCARRVGAAWSAPVRAQAERDAAHRGAGRQYGRGQDRRRGAPRGGEHRRLAGAAVGRGPARLAQLPPGRCRQDQGRRPAAGRRRDVAADAAGDARHRGHRHRSPSRRANRATSPRTKPSLAAHREQLAALLQQAGAASLDEAERLLAARRDVEARLPRRPAQLKAFGAGRYSSACSACTPISRHRRHRSARRSPSRTTRSKRGAENWRRRSPPPRRRSM